MRRRKPRAAKNVPPVNEASSAAAVAEPHRVVATPPVLATDPATARGLGMVDMAALEVRLGISGRWRP